MEITLEEKEVSKIIKDHVLTKLLADPGPNSKDVEVEVVVYESYGKYKISIMDKILEEKAEGEGGNDE